jgi:hypothetical protein
MDEKIVVADLVVFGGSVDVHVRRCGGRRRHGYRLRYCLSYCGGHCPIFAIRYR